MADNMRDLASDPTHPRKPPGSDEKAVSEYTGRKDPKYDDPVYREAYKEGYLFAKQEHKRIPVSIELVYREHIGRVDRVLWESFRHFYHQDHSNAAIHCAPVRYSPITFQLAECLNENGSMWPHSPDDEEQVRDVLAHRGKYEEDKGR